MNRARRNLGPRPRDQGRHGVKITRIRLSSGQATSLSSSHGQLLHFNSGYGPRMSVSHGTVPHMGRKALFDRDAIAALLARQNGVISRGQAVDCKMSETAVRHPIRPDGAWQPLLPGVYLSRTGTPTPVQREMAALLYAGPGSVITGPSALQFHHIWAPEAESVDVLVPAARRRRDVAFVRVLRTSRMPNTVFPPRKLRTEPRKVAAEIRSALDAGRNRAGHSIRALPSP